jgi:A/G-specific adenine glycosylase
MERYGGEFPGEYENVLALPGIGEYTAGAICSICFGLKTRAVDGNVLRVISRITDDATPIDLPAYKKQVQKALAEIYPAEAGDFTQALMELGATICGPNRKPDCDHCPCRAFCLAARRGTAEALPVKLPKKGRRQEEMTVFICVCDGKYAVEKRESQGLLADLWQFPNVSGHLEVQQAVDAAKNLGFQVKTVTASVEKNHIFTHVQWNMRGFYLETETCDGNFQWFTPEEINNEVALPTAFRQFWDTIQ